MEHFELQKTSDPHHADESMQKSIHKLEFDKVREMLAEMCASPMAKRMARELVPSTRVSEVRELQNQTSEALELLIAHGTIALGNFHDISETVKLAEIGSMLSPKRLLEVGDTLRASRKLRAFLMDKTEQFRYIGSLVRAISVHSQLEKEIENAILGENLISDNASSALRSIRRKIESKKNEIRDRLNSMVTSQAFSKYLQDTIVTIRNDRFVLPVKAEHRNSVSGMVHDQSAKGGTVYIEPMAVVNLNNDLTTLALEEDEEIRKILTELSAGVGSVAASLRQNADIMTALDFVVGKGKLALKYKAVLPEITEERFVKIRNGRHPLLPADKVVPLNIWVGKSFQTLLITGPNTGGKTVSLKTVGIFALMAQSGLHLPADHGTTMPIFEHVLADIGDEQSIAQSLSTFSAHMTNIVWILKVADSRSLVLLDELGAGTDPTEGAALAISILETFRRRGLLTIATTHYAELKQYALVNEGVENASVEFDVATLSPTYRLLVGIPGKSNAFEISKKLGLGTGIIEDAKSRLMTQSVDFEQVLAKVTESQQVAEKERDEAIRLRLDAATLKKRNEEIEQKIKQDKDRIIADARAEGRAILRKAKQEVEAVVKELKNIGSNAQGADRLKKRLKDNMDELSDSAFDFEAVASHEGKEIVFKEGSKVMFLPLKTQGVVISAPNAKGDCEIALGSMKMKANINQLQYLGERTSEEKSGSKRKYGAGEFGTGMLKSASVRPEIDVRGMNFEDAVNVLQKY
ncbi:MAG: endonuclease MutS2, partial [Bacillota bacterium]|nr:endonuclease MutS2 [Bacillota bacterium]